MSPSIFAFIFVGSVVWFICSFSCVLYSAGSGVKNLHVVLDAFRMRLFVCAYISSIVWSRLLYHQ